MNVANLKLFIEAARLGSFSAVASAQSIAVSSVSRAIAALEADLGARLFQRTTRRIVLTEEGAMLHARIEPLLQDLDRAFGTFAEQTSAPQGSLRITASVAFGVTCVLPILDRFRERFPAVKLDLLLSDERLDPVAHRIDLAIRLGPLEPSGLVARKLMDTRYFVCVSPRYLKASGHPRRPEALAARECLLLPFDGFRSLWRFRASSGAVREVPVSGRITVSNPLALLECARAGLGPALLADWLVEDDLRTGRLVRLFPGLEASAGDFASAAWLVYPSRSYMPRKVRAFVEMLEDDLRQRRNACRPGKAMEG